MSDRCYKGIECPSMFPSDGDCENFNHGLKAVGGCLVEGDPVMSSILLQLGSDRHVDGERGWWGEQFLGFPLGTRLWTLAGKPVTQQLRVEFDEAIREAADPLIDQGCIDDLTVRIVDTIDGPTARVQFFKDGQAILEMAT